tara:strand:+ start:257 stop:577 length:321 start_codon:yes stop_codon:yes gene_type:complete
MVVRLRYDRTCRGFDGTFAFCLTGTARLELPTYECNLISARMSSEHWRSTSSSTCISICTGRRRGSVLCFDMLALFDVLDEIAILGEAGQITAIEASAQTGVARQP